MLTDFIWAESNGQPIPDGMYYARFTGVEPAPEREFDGKKTPGVRWQFEVQTGPHTGRAIGRITGLNPTEKSKCGAILSGLLGRTPKIGDPCDPTPCVGRTYAVVLSKGLVETVSVPPQQ